MPIKHKLLVLCNFLILCTPEALRACENPIKGVCFQFCEIKVGNPGVWHKTRFEGDQKILTFGFMQLFDLTQP
jgi:hypothetical protein